MGASCDTARRSCCGVRDGGSSPEDPSTNPIRVAAQRQQQQQLEKERRSTLEEAKLPTRRLTAEEAKSAHLSAISGLLVDLHQSGNTSVLNQLQPQFDRIVKEFAAMDYDELVSGEGMLVETKADLETKMPICRTRYLLPGSKMEELLQLFHDVKQRGAWEAKYKVGKKKIQILQQTDEPDSADEHDSLTMTNVVLFTFPGKMMVSGREFLDRRVSISVPSQKVYVCIAGAALDMEEVALADGLVRGETVFEATVIIQTPEGAVVYSINLSDPKGNVPAAAVKAGMKSRPKDTVKAMKKAYKERFGDTTTTAVKNDSPRPDKIL